jgi:hypothetical protein
MVGIHRIVLAFSIVYVRYDEAFGERYKIIYHKLSITKRRPSIEVAVYVFLYTYILIHFIKSPAKPNAEIFARPLIITKTLVCESQ